MADLAKRYKTNGVCLWTFGGEGPEFWDTLDRVESTPKETAASGKSFVNAAVPRGPRVRDAEIFTDKTRGYWFYARDNDPNDLSQFQKYNPRSAPPYSSGDSDSSFVSVVEKNGKFWADYKLKGDTSAKGGIVVGHLDLGPYLDHGALRFFIRGNKGGETLKVGFTTSPGLTEDDAYEMENTIPLEGYVDVSTEWKLVTIPLDEFHEKVSWVDELTNEEYRLYFNWNRVYEFTIQSPSGGERTVDFQISNVRITPSYRPQEVHPR